MRPQLVLVPLVNVRRIQAYYAFRYRPDADQQARQRGFPRGARPDDAQHVARLHGKADVMQHRFPLRARRRGGNAFNRQRAGRTRQRHAGAAFRVLFQQLDQPVVRQLGRAPAFPDVDHLFDRRQGAPHQDRTGDHHAGGDVAVDGQPAAQPQHQRLQGKAHELGDRGDGRGALAGDPLAVQETAVQ
ncbi:Uncharacterised protein [Serratia entomophila]|nr:Uncharacterised protein [Serratia entomophila]